MPKNKPNKGVLKRIRITGTGRARVRRAYGGHLRSHKSGKLIRSYRKSDYASPSDAKRLEKQLFRPVKGSKRG